MSVTHDPCKEQGEPGADFTPLSINLIVSSFYGLIPIYPQPTNWPSVLLPIENYGKTRCERGYVLGAGHSGIEGVTESEIRAESFSIDSFTTAGKHLSSSDKSYSFSWVKSILTTNLHDRPLSTEPTRISVDPYYPVISLFAVRQMALS